MPVETNFDQVRSVSLSALTISCARMVLASCVSRRLTQLSCPIRSLRLFKPFNTSSLVPWSCLLPFVVVEGGKLMRAGAEASWRWECRSISYHFGRSEPSGNSQVRLWEVLQYWSEFPGCSWVVANGRLGVKFVGDVVRRWKKGPWPIASRVSSHQEVPRYGSGRSCSVILDIPDCLWGSCGWSNEAEMPG